MEKPFGGLIAAALAAVAAAAAALPGAAGEEPRAAAAAARLRVPEGFSIEAAAGAPEIRFPMFAALDDGGRLYVAESSGLDLYAELQALTRRCRVSRLEDADGDGRYERAAVFAGGLVFPMGLAWRDGRLYVADPPDLIAIEDADGDGRADRRAVILSGFGHQDNGSLHGLVFGPDERLYMTLGRPDGYRIERPDGTVIEGGTGALIRCRPDGSEVEVVARGFENLVEVVFLPDGEIIGTDNWYQQPRDGLRDALVHVVEGGLYPMHPALGDPMPATGPPLPPLALYPAVALSGLERHSGLSFPESYRGSLLSAQHNARRVVRHVLEPDGSTFRSRDLDFVWTDDPDFHPSDVLEDADGSVLVIDTGGWYVQHCPTGRIRDSRAPGGIHRVRWREAAPVADPRGREIDAGRAPIDRLAALLGDPRPSARRRARHAIAARGADAVPALAEVLESSGGGGGGSEAGRQAAWALAAIPGEEALAPLRRLIDRAAGGEGGELAALAARALASRGDRAAAPALERLLRRGGPSRRLAAAEALARCGRAESAPALIETLEEGADRFLEHALVLALHRHAAAADIESALARGGPQVQAAALLILDQPPRRRLEARAVLERAASADAGLRRTALGILESHPEWAGEAAGFVRGLIEEPRPSGEERDGLRALVLAFQETPGVADLTAAAVAGRAEGIPPATRLHLIETLAASGAAELPRSWVEALEAALADADGAVRLAAARAAAALQLPALERGLARLGGDAEQPRALRLAALRGIAAAGRPLGGEPFEFLLGLLAGEGDALERLAAAEALAGATLAEDEFVRLLEAAGGDPLISPAVLLPALRRASGERGGAAAMDYIERTIEAGWRPPEREIEEALAALPAAAGGAGGRAAALIARLRRAREEMRQRLAGFEALIEGGDPARGREVFLGRKAGCAVCHRAGGEGGAVGPDLSRIGAARSGRDLIESILVPGSTFVQGFEPYLVITRDGRTAAGVIARRTEEVLVLRDSSGAELRFPNDRIRDLRRQETSIMPDGLERVLDRGEFRDLLAYLLSLR